MKNLKFSPPSEHSNISLLSRFSTNFFRFAFSNAVQIWWSWYSSNGSKFIRNVPENKTGSLFIFELFRKIVIESNSVLNKNTCGIIVNFCLKSCKPIDWILMSSILISPSVKSRSRNRAEDKLLFPAPVRPQIPTYRIEHYFLLYLITNFQNWTFFYFFTRINCKI